MEIYAYLQSTIARCHLEDYKEAKKGSVLEWFNWQDYEDLEDGDIGYIIRLIPFTTEPPLPKLDPDIGWCSVLNLESQNGSMFFNRLAALLIALLLTSCNSKPSPSQQVDDVTKLPSSFPIIERLKLVEYGTGAQEIFHYRRGFCPKVAAVEPTTMLKPAPKNRFLHLMLRHKPIWLR
ncbi:MAG: hypothetical protein HC935_06745 [Pseudanabaena sp. SU_2_4]|nr:hypothetical protein [Pseudanabaena sp. SU_2_4]